MNIELVDSAKIVKKYGVFTYIFNTAYKLQINIYVYFRVKRN